MSLAAFRFTARARPVIELGIGSTTSPSGQAKWDQARWDTPGDEWSGIEPTWLDISCETRSVRFEYGRRRVTDRFVAGAATIVVDNSSGWADVPSDPGSLLSIRPGRAIRISVDHVVFGRRVLWRGFVDAMTPRYAPIDTDTVELACIDALGEVNRAKLVPLETPVGDGEDASTRVHRILDAVSWLEVKRDVWPGSTGLVPTNLGGQVADLLGQAADSAGGAVFGDLEARIAYRPRDWQTFPPTTPIDGTIGNVPPTPNYVVDGADDIMWNESHVIFGAATGDVCPVEWERPFERSDIATRSIMGRDLATAVQRDDPAGQILYGIEPFERTDLLTKEDADLVTLAERVLRVRSAGGAPRVRSVSLNAATAANALDLMATVDVYRPSRYRCRLVYPAPRGLVFDEEYFATAVVHEMTPGAWTLELNLDPAAPFAAAGARWDRAGWDRSTWTVSAP